MQNLSGISRLAAEMTTRRSSRRCAEDEVITLHKQVPGCLLDEAELEELRKDLEKMGCARLLELPWSFRDVAMVWEILKGAPNQFDTTIKCDPSHWIARQWREVYPFRPGGSGLASRKDDFARTKFAHSVDPKDGYPLKDCLIEREKMVLEFLVPILHPEKPNRVTITIGNTIFGALSGEREVDWGKVIGDMVHKLVGGVGKAKGSPLSPFLYHLYKHEGLLTPEEETN